MVATQTVFEAGLMTYHRMDSPTIDTEYMLIRQYTIARNLPLPDTAPAYKAKAGMQEAHEGIRVTDIHRDVGNRIGVWTESQSVDSHGIPHRDQEKRHGLENTETERGSANDRVIPIHHLP